MFERRLEAGQVSSLMIAFTDGRPPVELLRVPDMVVEAPNWTSDGRWLIVNADGRLWRVAAAGDGELEPIDVQGIPDLNNDHVLAPDGEHIYLSANDGHIYQAPLDGGRARRVTNMDRPERMHFLHGVSPDGRWLSYIGLQPSNRDWSANVFLIPTVGVLIDSSPTATSPVMVVNSLPMGSGSSSIPKCSAAPRDTRRSHACGPTDLIFNS